MEKLNIAELLRDCPTGMELDSTLFEGLEFDCIVDNEYLPIRCRIKHPNGGYTVYNFTKYGCWLDTTFAKCVIFPKGKTTWEGFQRPFKDGDIVFYDDNIAIFKEWGDKTLYKTYVKLYIHRTSIDKDFPLFGKYIRKETRFATEKEKEILFKAIKDNGYKWNSKTKTLEKLIESKEDTDDKIVMSGIYFDRNNYADEVELHLDNYEIEIRDGKTYAIFKNQETKTLKPKFKVGDRIKEKKAYISGIITDISDGTYKIEYKNGGVAFATIEFQSILLQELQLGEESLFLECQ